MYGHPTIGWLILTESEYTVFVVILQRIVPKGKQLKKYNIHDICLLHLFIRTVNV